MMFAASSSRTTRFPTPSRWRVPAASVGSETTDQTRDAGYVTRRIRKVTTGSVSAAFGTWAGYAACVLALLYAAVSLYWAAGGTAGLSTIGGGLEELGRARDPGIVALVWITGLLKVLAGLLALALVRPWGRVLPRRLLLVTAWGGATLLALYGGLLVVVQALLVSGVIAPAGSVDWTALWWHLLVWDPWFLVWGILLGVAAWYYQRGTRNQKVGTLWGTPVGRGNKH